jgi:tRNA pseudouridine13 synthase
MALDWLETPPLWTADLPGIGGKIKQNPEDFEVEEVPAYQPCGNGAYVYLWIEKRSLGAEYLVREMARRLGILSGEIGTAGMKDRHAVTRQMVSLPARVADRVGGLEIEGLKVLKISRHGNKLRPGHLHGNRFRVLIRGVEPDAGDRLEPIVRRLRETGMPNYYGRQRFGTNGDNVRLGLGLLRNEPPPVTEGRPVNLRNPFLRKLTLSSVQSALFNRYLARRQKEGLMRKVVRGDVMCKWPTGGMFVAEDVAAEQARLDNREIIPGGPIFGRKVFPAGGAAAGLEGAILSEAGLTGASFKPFGKLLRGTRRFNIVYVDDLAAHLELEGVRLTFTLPAGSYATVLLREIMKNDPEGEEEEV